MHLRRRGPSRLTAVPILALLAALLAGCGGDGGDSPVSTGDIDTGAPAPVVILLIDTLRADHVGFHGDERGTTPFLDALSAESFVFDRAYANASWTRPSVASLFTSRIPRAHGCENRDGVLAGELVTLAEAFKMAGWPTQGVIANGNVTGKLGFAQGFDDYVFIKDRPNPYADADQMVEPVEFALDTIGEESPYFLYLHYVDPHDPYHPREGHDFMPGYEGDMDGSQEALKPFQSVRPDDETYDRVLALYNGEIAWLDARLRQLFAVLEERGVLDDAWLVVTSDHGEGLWDHRVRAHGQEVYEEQIRVPLFIRPPGGLDAEVSVDRNIALMDLAPTLLELVGVPRPRTFDGASWAPFLAGDEPAPELPVIVDEIMDHFELAAIIEGDDKLIVDFKKDVQLLYDLESNPREQRSEAFDPRLNPTPEGQRLQRILVETWRDAKARAPVVSGPNADDLMTDEERQMLAEIGYGGEFVVEPEDDPPAGGAMGAGGMGAMGAGAMGAGGMGGQGGGD